jgi:DNA-binding transcriptional ArsR family regulator
MVEYSLQLDSVFNSLADPTRRDILLRVAGRELSVNEIAAPYPISLAAISKHLKVLEKARLINKRREGKQHIVSLVPETLRSADEHLEQYRQMWQGRFNKLDALLKDKE